jgi:hypothetical protein
MVCFFAINCDLCGDIATWRIKLVCLLTDRRFFFDRYDFTLRLVDLQQLLIGHTNTSPFLSNYNSRPTNFEPSKSNQFCPININLAISIIVADKLC